MRLRLWGLALCTTLSLLPAIPSLAQTGTRIIDSLAPGSPANALPESQVKTNPGTIPSAPSATGAGGASEQKPFVLKSVRVDGDDHLAPQAVKELWEPLVGKSVTLDDVRHLADGVSALYKTAGYALYTVSIPKQSFDNGVVVIRAVEGHVEAVTVEVTDQKIDVALIKAYAARLIAEQPLRQKTLERYILLMSDLPGYKVGSKFEAIPGSPGAYRLVLGVDKKDFDAGAGFVNLGQPLLSDTQFAVNGVANGLFREGDRTQIVYGFAPDGFRNYQYYGLIHQTPIGDDGITLQLNGGYLDTNVDGLTGRAYLAGIHVNDPLIREVKETLLLNVGFDALNSDDAVLGSAISDERTRAFRGTLAYALQDNLFDLTATNTAVGTLSGGFPILDARRGSPVFGGPGFGKFNTRVERDQQLPWEHVILRLRVAGQFSGGHLPESEEFTFGGEDFGRAFDYDTLNGDRGIATAGELAYQFGPYHPWSVTTLPELYSFADWGEIWNTDTFYLHETDRAASAGIGSRVTFGDHDQTIASLELARDIERPLYSPSPPAWRVVFSIRRQI
jgi:hemolysin activation/secretion protein